MPRASSGTGGIPPFPRVTMSPQDEIKLLKIVKDDDEFRYTFCTPSMAKPRQHEIAQRLCLEVMKSEVYFLGYAKKTGMIRQVNGVWQATDKWSTKVHNPVRTKLRAMTDSYKKAQEKYKRVLKPEQTKFADVPAHARGDLLVECPHFFRLKELCDPTEPLRVPRVRTPAPGPARPVRPRVELGNRPTRRAFPSPSPSEAPPSPTAPPSPSRSPSPSPPEPVAARPFLALRPMSNTARSQDSSSFTRAPRALVRPNAVASSSRVAVKVERESSPSSSESSSDVEMLPAVVPRPTAVRKNTVDSSAFTRPNANARPNAVASSSRVPIKIKREPSPTPSSSSSSSDVEHVSANASIASRQSIRPNATASSSRKRIKVEPSPSISSSSSSTSDSSSDHEMENDWVSEPEEGSASPEKRDWLNLAGLRPLGASNAMVTPAMSAFEHDAAHTRLSDSNSSISNEASDASYRAPGNALTPAISSPRRQGMGPDCASAVGYRGSGSAIARVTQGGPENAETESLSATTRLQAQFDDLDPDDPNYLLLQRKRIDRTISKKLGVASDDSHSARAREGRVPSAINHFSYYQLRYARARVKEDKDLLVHQAQLSVLCEALCDIERYLVVPPFLQGCLIRFDSVIRPYLRERVKQLARFASLAGAIITEEASAPHRPGCTRRMAVSHKITGFAQKVSQYKRGDSTYTIYHYSLLSFGKYCSDKLGDIKALRSKD